ncbi:MAG TPA: hypothetical protein VMQ73_11760 [Methylomirabilota bacterium]|nr:hypothetical protein [Methylomirabilota bacterium]
MAAAVEPVLVAPLAAPAFAVAELEPVLPPAAALAVAPASAVADPVVPPDDADAFDAADALAPTFVATE